MPLNKTRNLVAKVWSQWNVAFRELPVFALNVIFWACGLRLLFNKNSGGGEQESRTC